MALESCRPYADAYNSAARPAPDRAGPLLVACNTNRRQDRKWALARVRLRCSPARNLSVFLRTSTSTRSSQSQPPRRDNFSSTR